MTTLTSTDMGPIDMANLLQLNRLGAHTHSEPFAVRATRVFLRTAPGLVAKLRHGYDARDAAAVRIATHTLKSSSNSLGALHLSRMASRLEIPTRENSLQGAETLIQEIEQEFPRVSKALEQFVADSGAGASA